MLRWVSKWAIDLVIAGVWALVAAALIENIGHHPRYPVEGSCDFFLAGSSMYGELGFYGVSANRQLSVDDGVARCQDLPAHQSEFLQVPLIPL
jgi:hypothetical protein